MPDAQVRRNLAPRQTTRERDPNRIPLELVAVYCCHIQSPFGRASLSEDRNGTATGSNCGYELQGGSVTTPLENVVMSEIDLLKRSSFVWEDLFGDDAALMASEFSAWGGVFFLEGRWHAVGGARGQPTCLLGVGDRTVCLAQADDWLNTHESDESAFKSKRWLTQTPTEKQLQYLSPAQRQDYGLTRYRASALITFQFNRRDIRRLVMTAALERRAA